MEDLVQVLTKFHREIVVPDIERIVGAAELRLRDEMHSLFDGLAHEIKSLREAYYMLLAGLKRVEERLDRVEERLEKLALRSELAAFKAQLDGLQEQVRTLEGRLED